MAIVVSHIDEDFDVLTRRALRQAPLADLIEIRLDLIGHPGRARMEEFFKAAPKPVIVSCNGSEAFGSFTGSADEMFDLYHDAAEVGARFVDIDFRYSLDLGEVEAPCHRIVSRHEETTPENLDELLEEIQAVLYEGDVTKLVTFANSCEDGLALLNWLRTTKGVVAFAAGAAGRFTRVLAPIFGSPFTYCAAAEIPGEAAGAPTAPGQIRVNDLHAQLPPGGISQETAIFAVVGNPVGHSWSPWVHGMALKAARLDAVFVALEPSSFPEFLALACDENFRGLSITAPFKAEAFAAASARDESSERTGAVNTLVREGDVWHGANTDVAAVRETLRAIVAFQGRAGQESAPGPSTLEQTRALILGTGGAARACVWALRSVGATVLVAGRDAERARALAAEHDCEAIEWDTIGDTEYDVLVNATPIGQAGNSEGEQIVPTEWIRSGSIVLDAVYRPIRTAFLAAAHERGATPIPGGEWFVRQAIAQFKLFTGADPDEDLMRKSFEHAHAAAARDAATAAAEAPA